MHAVRLAAVLAWVSLVGVVALADESAPRSTSAVLASVRAEMERLGSSDPRVRIEAARKLGMMGEQAAAAAPALAGMLGDNAQAKLDSAAEASICGSTAAFALRELGQAGRDALIEALKDPRPGVRARAAQGLGGMKQDRRAIAPLVALLKDQDPLVRASAAWSLGDFNHDVSMGMMPPGKEQALVQEALLAALDDPVWRVRETAARGFMFTRNDRALQTLRAGLQDEDPAIRAEAAQSLELFGDQRAVDPLIAALRDRAPQVRGAAALALGRLKGSLREISQPQPWNPKAKRWQDPDPRAVRALAATLHDADPTVREKAATALGDSRDPGALKSLLYAAKDPNATVVASAVSALGRLGDARAIPALVKNLRHQDPAVRAMAAQGFIDLRLRTPNSDLLRVAGTPLLAALKDKDPQARGIAAYALGAIRDSRAVGPLIMVLQKDPASFPRDRAAVALGELADPRAINPLSAALRDKEPEVRRMAALALADLANAFPSGRARTVDALIGALQDNDAEVRTVAALSLEGIGDRRAVKPLQALLNDENELVRQEAARALGELRGPDAEASAAAMASVDPQVREASICGVVEAGGPRAVDALIAALQDPNERVRASALNAAFYPERSGRPVLKDARLVEPLIGALRDESLSVKIGAILGLCEQQDSRGVDPLIAALKDEQPQVRGWAAAALAALKDARAVAPLVELLKDEDVQTRTMTAGALGAFKDPRTVAPLVAALQDPEHQVRERAAASLGEMKDPRIEPALIGALKDTDAHVKRSAAAALGRLGTPGAVDALLAAVTDHTLSAEERTSAVIGLGESRDRRAAAVLITVLRDPEATVRSQAASALGSLKETRAIEPLIALLSDRDAMVRGAAAGALTKITGQNFGMETSKWKRWRQRNPR